MTPAQKLVTVGHLASALIAVWDSGTEQEHKAFLDLLEQRVLDTGAEAHDVTSDRVVWAIMVLDTALVDA